MFGLTEHQSVERMRKLVQQVKINMRLQSPPFYQGVNDPIAAHLGLTVQEHELPLDEGQYIADHRLIIIDPRVTDPGRRNFTFFHEICHALVRQDDILYSFIHQYASRDEDFDAILEYYCNIGAAEFLIPAKDVCDAITKQGFTIRLIEQLDTNYPASKPAIATQLAHCATHKCFVVVCAYGDLQYHKEPMLFDNQQVIGQLRMYILYSANSPQTFKYKISRFGYIPQDHLISQAYSQQSYIRAKDCVPFRNNRTWITDCEAFFYKGRVYAAFHASPPPDPTAQLPTLFDLFPEA